MKKLDRSRPFGEVHGAHHGAVTYQDGHYFDAGDCYVISDPGVAVPADAETEDASAPAEVDVSVIPAGMTKVQMLSQLTVTQLKTLVSKAGGEPVIGSGAKAKMIAWLIDNTQ